MLLSERLPSCLMHSKGVTSESLIPFPLPLLLVGALALNWLCLHSKAKLLNLLNGVLGLLLSKGQGQGLPKTRTL